MPPNRPINPLDHLFASLQRGLDMFMDDLQNTAEDFLLSVNRQAVHNLRRQIHTAEQQRTGRPVRPPMRPPGQSAPSPTPKPYKPPKQREKTAYDYLEVSVYASQETISAAFQSLGRRFHPDNQATGDAERFKTISAAYTILKDPVRRKKYNRTIGA